MKPLLAFMQAKEIPQVLAEQENFNIDILRIKYVSYPRKLKNEDLIFPFQGPHELAIDYFLNNPEYTHLIFQPPDLIVKKENLDQLMTDIRGGFPVISGAANVDQDKYSTKWAATSAI